VNRLRRTVSCQPPLLERDDELTTIEGAACAARRGQGSVVVVSGPLGNGKSALCRALPSVAHRENMAVLRASGARLEQDFAYGLVRQLVDPALGTATAADRDEWLAGAAGRAHELLRECILLGPGRQDIPHQVLLAGLDALVHNMSRCRPLMVLVDDLQWADSPSLAWLDHLVVGLGQLPVLVVCAVRDGDPGSRQPTVHNITEAARVVQPRPLSVAGVRALVEWHAGQPADQEFVTACRTATGGNPMFLMSILVDLAADDVPPVAAMADRVAAARPAQLRDRLLACLRAQPEPVREIAQALTVLGEHADRHLVERMTGLDAVAWETALRTFDQLGLLTARRTHRFAHGFVRDAFEESMTLQEREKAHVRALEALHESGRPVEQVATLLLKVSSVQVPWAAETLRGAADVAVRRGAPDVAAGYLRRLLLDTSPDGPDRAALYLELARVERGFDSAASVRHVTQATALVTEPRERAEALVRLAPAVLGDAPGHVHDLLRRVSAELGDPYELKGTERELALRLEARTRRVGWTDPVELAASARRLRDLGVDQAVTTGAERELRTVLLHAAMMTLGSTAGEVAMLGSLILQREPATPEHVHGTLPLLVEALCAADSLDDVAPWLDTAMRHALAGGTPMEQGLIQVEQSLVALHRGRLTEARRAVHAVLGTAAIDWQQTGTAILVPLSLVAVATRDDELVRRLLADHPPEGTNVLVPALLGLLRGAVATAEGDLPAALAYTVDSGWQLERAGWRTPGLLPWRTTLVGLHKRLGDLGAAREAAEQEWANARQWGAPATVGRATRVLGDLTPGADGVVLLREAVDVLEKSANRSELARALIRLAERVRHNVPSEAANHLRRARAVAVDCGDEHAETWADRVAGGSSGPGLPGELTKAECRVVSMAVDGLTNSQIAGLLQVSVRAVEKHLTNSFRKLGVRRRTDLTAALRARQD
jgi:DNA-binding NarL/FixJ family response regulator